MKKSTQNLLTASVALSLTVTVLSAVFSYIALTNNFDHDIGHYAANSVISTLAVYLPFVAAAVSAVCAILLRKKAVFTEKPRVNIPTIFSSVLTGLLIGASSVFEAVNYASPFVSYGYNTMTTLSNLAVPTIIFGFISAVYFILYPFFKDKPFMSLLAFTAPVWITFKLLEEYFREGSPINSPIRTANLAMFAFLLLFFAEEIRFAIGTQSVGICYFCTLNAIAFTGNAVLPKLAVIITGKNTFDFSLIECCLGVAILLFLLSRLLAAPAAIGDQSEADSESTASRAAEG